MSEQNKGGKPTQITAAQIFARLKRAQDSEELAANRKRAHSQSLANKARRGVIPEFARELDEKYFFYPQIEEQIANLFAAPEQKRNALTALLGAAFLKAAEKGNSDKISAILDHGFPVNYQDPRTGQAALHIAVACQARDALRVLLKTGECDFLLRDKQGRLASEMAYLYGEDAAVARFLGIKERKQAERAGITLTRRPSQ